MHFCFLFFTRTRHRETKESFSCGMYGHKSFCFDRDGVPNVCFLHVQRATLQALRASSSEQVRLLQQLPQPGRAGSGQQARQPGEPGCHPSAFLGNVRLQDTPAGPPGSGNVRRVQPVCLHPGCLQSRLGNAGEIRGHRLSFGTFARVCPVRSPQEPRRDGEHHVLQPRRRPGATPRLPLPTPRTSPASPRKIPIQSLICVCFCVFFVIMIKSLNK